MEDFDDLRVTWLLPVKNGMPFLPETLASIAAQTYRNFEVLAWDNGSTDGTLEELRKWIPACLPGCIVSDRPLGLAESLAEMVCMAKTDLCARIDADDVNLPDRLEKQVSFLRDHPEVALVGSQYVHLDADGQTHGLVCELPTDHEAIVLRLLHANAIAHPAVLFRREAILEAGNYRNIGKINVEDYDLWLRLAVRHRLANLSEPLLNYRIHAKSTTQEAIASNCLLTALNARFIENAPALFGCTTEEARQLREMTHPFVFPVLRRIASHLAHQWQVPVRQILRSQLFLDAACHFIAPKDIKSRLRVAALHPDKATLRTKLTNIIRDIVVHTPLGTIRDSLKTAQIKRRMQAMRTEWFRQQVARGSKIDATLQVRGELQPYARMQLGTECLIEPDVTFWVSADVGAQAQLVLEDRVFIGRNTFIGVYHPITVGKHSMIGAYCYLISANHCYASRDVPIRDQGFIGAPITIEEDVWIGTHVVILPGVTISKGAIIAAGSIVNRNVPPYEIWGGVPARFLKERP